jgi:hypothetical protein
MPVPHPDDTPVKLERRGLGACSRVASCAVVLDIPGAGAFPGSED